MTYIADYIQRQVNRGLTNGEIGNTMGVNDSMISRYKKEFYPSLDVAVSLYQFNGVVLFPYNEKALIKLAQERTNA